MGKEKWVLEGAYEGPYGKRYQFRSAEEIAPGYYDHMEVSAKYFWEGILNALSSHMGYRRRS
jgi:hypothetical protein